MTSYQITRIFGIPIKLHITLLIVLPLLALNVSSTGLSFLFGLIAVCILFAGVLLHELGHAYVTLRLGGAVRQIILLPIGGVAQLEHMSTRPRDEVLIAVAGPLVSLLLALGGWAVAFVLTALQVHTVALLAMIFAGVNTMLCLFNLIPAFPMDGGRVLRALLASPLGRVRATRIAGRIGQALAVCFGFVAIFGIPGTGYSGNLILLAIAVFIYVAAGSEYRAVRAHEFAGRMADLKRTWLYESDLSTQGPTRTIDPRDIRVSPSPYQDDPRDRMH